MTALGILITLLSLLVTLILGLVVLLRDPRQQYARAFAAMCGSIVVWVLANQATNDPTGQLNVINMANKLAFVGGYATIFFGLLFTYHFPSERAVSLNERLVVGMMAVISFTISLLEPVVGLAIYRGGQVHFVSGEWIMLYVVMFIATLGFVCRNLIEGNARRRSRVQQMQARLILGAFVASAVIGLTFNVIIPYFAQSWLTTMYGPLSILILVGLISYTIVRHRLFDIRLAVVRGVAYVLSIATLGLLYVSLAYGVTRVLFPDGVASIWVDAALALALAFIFQPVSGFFNRVTDRIFYRDSYKPDELYTRLNKVLTSTTQLHDLLVRGSVLLGEALKAEQISFFVYQSNGHPLSVGSRHHLKPTVADMRALDVYVKEQEDHRLITTEELPSRHPVRRLLVGYRIVLVMPLLQREQVVGYLLLGDKRSGVYTRQDIRVLETVADELVIAIQNAAAVEEIRNLNANLQQRIDAATEELRTSNDQLRSLDVAKDEFVSMASHQLRTPLTSVKGYISMVLEGDGGKVTKVQKQLLSEAFVSSERMVHLINDFLNVSRVQTGKFMIERHEVDLVKVVRQEVDQLRRTAESRDLTLKADLPKQAIRLQLDEGKIRQVIMNFIDNALYYSRPDTEIVVSLKTDKKEVRLEVIDHGIGVPAAQQAGLFTKFFRADNARTQRPDGTGVGLYLAKMVIDGHGGKLIFSSKEGVGSTFGFKLPLETSQSDDADKTDHKQA